MMRLRLALARWLLRYELAAWRLDRENAQEWCDNRDLEPGGRSYWQGFTTGLNTVLRSFEKK